MFTILFILDCLNVPLLQLSINVTHLFCLLIYPVPGKLHKIQLLLNKYWGNLLQLWTLIKYFCWYNSSVRKGKKSIKFFPLPGIVSIYFDNYSFYLADQKFYLYLTNNFKGKNISIYHHHLFIMNVVWEIKIFQIFNRKMVRWQFRLTIDLQFKILNHKHILLIPSFQRAN